MNLIFGVIYVFIAIVLALDFYLGFSSMSISLLLSVYLIGKGVMSALTKNSILSALDSVSGFYFLFLELSIFPVNFVTVIFLIYLAQKGVTKIFSGMH